MFIFDSPPLLWAEPMRRTDCNPSLNFDFNRNGIELHSFNKLRLPVTF